ncbi:DUF4179 domain-containing protein [Clostridium nigeriense]|uniref:DUF4179 domain-containing protein n=1 Tax=Clostridium nigeriense TaxID=1805470 RepID=UPI00083301CE|nr:DUF4179 domain-containing protein [Clostridium nigeriense]
MKNIYKAFNNIDVNIDEYDNTELTTSEIEKYKNMISEKIYIRKRPIYRQIAALIILSIISFSILNTSNVNAIINSFGKNLKDIFKISENKHYDNYANIINKTVTDNNISVSIEEILIEENKLIVSSTIDYNNLPEKLKKSIIDKTKDILVLPLLYINDIELKSKSSQFFKISDDKIRYISLFDLENASKSKPLNCSLSYKFSSVSFKKPKNGYIEKEINGTWAFDFSLNTTNIINSQKELYLKNDNMLTYKNGDVLKINKIEKSDISIKIYYNLDTKSDHYSIPPFFLIDSNNNYLSPYTWNNEYSIFFIKDSDATNIFTVSGYDHGASENIIVDLGK